MLTNASTQRVSKFNINFDVVCSPSSRLSQQRYFSFGCASFSTRDSCENKTPPSRWRQKSFRDWFFYFSLLTSTTPAMCVRVRAHVCWDFLSTLFSTFFFFFEEWLRFLAVNNFSFSLNIYTSESRSREAKIEIDMWKTRKKFRRCEAFVGNLRSLGVG